MKYVFDRLFTVVWYKKEDTLGNKNSDYRVRIYIWKWVVFESVIWEEM